MVNYPEVGKVYKSLGSERRVVEITKNSWGREVVHYTKNGSAMVRRVPLEAFMREYMGNNIKPLDQAFKELDKQLCSHRNIIHDKWFTSKVFKHCKDCGKAIE
jgi:hypothetical protein